MVIADDIYFMDRAEGRPCYRIDPLADKTSSTVYGRPHFRHAGRCNIAWLDGHVDSWSGNSATPLTQVPFGAGNEKYYVPTKQ